MIGFMNSTCPEPDTIMLRKNQGGCMLVSNNAKLVFRMFELEKESFVVLPDKDHFDCLRFAADLYVHFAANGKRWLLEGQAFQPGLDLIRQQYVGLCGNCGMIRVREGENYEVQYEDPADSDCGEVHN